MTTHTDETDQRPKSLGLLATSALTLALLAGCPSKDNAAADAQSAAPADSQSAAASASAAPVDPPAAVVAEDPGIPLNEAVVGSAPVAEDFHATVPPPEAVVEDPPPKPVESNIWIPGYWWWSPPLGRYVWVGGAWRNPPPDQVWQPGSWTSVGPEQYVWVPGMWATRGFVRETIVEAPPPLRVETIGVMPGPGFFWTPGYYAWRGGSYTWVVGNWMRPPMVGLGWIEPRYVGCYGHYYFQPGRWDYAASARGTVYMPNINVRAGMHVTPVPAPAAVVNVHASYVAASAHAVATGAVRTSSGGYVHTGGAVTGQAKGGGAATGEAHGGVVPGEPHGGATGEPHGGAPAPTHGGATGEPHGGGPPPPNETHGGGHSPPPSGGKPPPGHPGGHKP